jgi:hypothetical protein
MLDNKYAKDSDPQWEFSAAVDDFNKDCQDVFQALH